MPFHRTAWKAGAVIIRVSCNCKRYSLVKYFFTKYRIFQGKNASIDYYRETLKSVRIKNIFLFVSFKKNTIFAPVTNL